MAAPFVMAMFLGACSTPDDTVVRLGLIVDGTADEASAVRYVAQLAVDEVTQSGGLQVAGSRLPVELFVYDTGGTPQGAVEAARRLIARDHVRVVIGPSRSRDALAVAPLAEQTGTLMLSPKSTHPALTEDRRWVFRLVITDLQQGRMLARFARHDLQANRVAMLYDAADAYGRTISQAFHSAFEAEGGEVIGVQAFTTGNRDFTEPLRQLASLKPDLLFLPGYDESARRQLHQLRSIDLDCPILGSDGWSPRSAKSAEGGAVYLSQHWFADVASESPEVQAFVTRYEEEFGYPPYDLAALSYDAFQLYFQAVSQAGSLEPNAVRDQLADLEEAPGLTGPFTFRGRGGDPLKSLLLLRSDLDGATLHRRLAPQTTVQGPTEPSMDDTQDGAEAQDGARAQDGAEAPAPAETPNRADDTSSANPL